MVMGCMAGNTETFPIIELRAAQLETTDLSPPERLIHVPDWTAAQATRTRTFTLDMPMMGNGMGMGMGMGGMMGRPRMEGPMGINGRSMNKSRIDERVAAGSVEIPGNQEYDANFPPLSHIHGVQFRTLDRNREPPSLLHEQGLKDTVLVDAGSTVRIITEFADFADPQRPYMYHCHILEHEDAGMMGAIRGGMTFDARLNARHPLAHCNCEVLRSSYGSPRVRAVSITKSAS